MATDMFAGRKAAAALLAVLCLSAYATVGLAAGGDTLAQQLPTPTPFRFLTPTPFVPGATTTSPTTSTAPRAGGFPMELAVPVLAGGLAAIGGGTLFLRRKSTN